VLDVVFSLLLVASCQVESSNSSLRLPVFLLNEEPGYQVARPVEPVSAVHSDQTSSLLGRLDSRVELLHTILRGKCAVTRHLDLDVTPAKLLAVSSFVVTVGVGQVHNVLQGGDGLAQLG